MKSAYHAQWLSNLQLTRETKNWMKADFISAEQFNRIKDEHPSLFFHPNFIIRILLFIAALIALSGVTGILMLMVSDIDEDAFPYLMIIYGVLSFFALDLIVVKNMKHYKSGITEAALYHAVCWLIAGIVWLIGDAPGLSLAICTIICALAAFRYHDLVLTVAFTGCFASFLFYNLFEAGDVGRQIIPIVFILVFAALYFGVKSLKRREFSILWQDCLTVLEALSLLVVYAAGNYFVVRELTVNMLGIYLEEGQDIPLAFLFYGLTVIIPILYLYFAIKNRDIVLLRVSLIALAFSAFTFKYYFSLGHPEITLTLAGFVLITAALAISRYLKTPRRGFTREQVLSEKWASANPEAFIISQTLGGNQVVADESFNSGGGGEFGGGGASGSY
jgi:hypothetical protein